MSGLWQSATSEHNILEQKVIDGIIIGQNRYYCSQKCRDEDNKGGLTGLIAIIGSAMIVSAAIGLADEFVGFVLFVAFATGIAVLAIMGARDRANRIHRPYMKVISALQRELPENQPVSEEFLEEYLSEEELDELRELEEYIPAQSENNIQIDPLPQRMSPDDDNLVYSDILQKYVDICCHQSARLSDKYCLCGKVMKYPTN